MSASLDDLAEPLRSAVKQLVRDAAAEGVTITWTSTRRTTAEQAALRIKNGCPDVYSSPASACRVPTARPGESKHEQGRAIDFTNTPAVLDAVAKRAGLYRIHRTVPGEPWHYEHTSQSTRAADAPAGTIPHSSVFGPLAGVAGAVTAPAQAIAQALGVLMDPATWLRVLTIVGGLGLFVAGLALLGVDLKSRAVATVAG